MVFPRPNRPQCGKAMSRAGPRCPFPKKRRRGGGGSRPEGGGPSSKGGRGVPARGVLRPARGQEAWEYHEPGPPNEPGPLAFSHFPNTFSPSLGAQESKVLCTDVLDPKARTSMIRGGLRKIRRPILGSSA